MKKIFRIYIKAFINFFLRKTGYIVLYRLGFSIGDQVCLSALVRKVFETSDHKIIVLSSFPEIFESNPKVSKNIVIKKNISFFNKLLRGIQGDRVLCFNFNKKISPENFQKKLLNPMHLAELHSHHWSLNIKSQDIKNEICFSSDEEKKLEEKYSFLPEKFCIIQPNSKLSYNKNKQWKIVNFQKVVDGTRNLFWVQVGSKGETVLQNVINITGQTSLRELFFLVKKAHLTLSGEGLINHIAGAFDVSSYVVLSGSQHENLAKYSNSIFIKSNKCKFSTCWELDDCKVGEKPCLSSIKPDEVINILQ